MKIEKTIPYSSRLTRWVDRLLPFQFTIRHEPERNLGMADYLSRHPSPSANSSLLAEDLWTDWFTVNEIATNCNLSGINQPQASTRIRKQ